MPGHIWTDQIVEYLPEVASSLIVATPKVHADVNDWIRAGASAADLLDAIGAAREIKPQGLGKDAKTETKGDVTKTIERDIGFYDVSKKAYLIRKESGSWLSFWLPQRAIVVSPHYILSSNPVPKPG